jgi:predicted transcriptional regulator
MKWALFLINENRMSINELERHFRAVANRRRLGILQLLHRQTPLPLYQIAAKIGLSVKTTNKHLGQLLHTGFIAKNRQKLFVFYQLEDEAKPLVAKLLKLIL